MNNKTEKYVSEGIRDYVTRYVYDSNRMSTEECIKKGLPYRDSKGWLRNTHVFCESGQKFTKNKKYDLNPRRSKGYMDFWGEERDRIQNGIWIGQLRVTGYFYFFLNYYRIIKGDEYGDEIPGFPDHWWLHFWWFHLFEYCDKTKIDFPIMKVRGCGLTEVAASIGITDYMVPSKKGTEKVFKSNAYFAYDEKYIKGNDKLLTRVTNNISWLNVNADKALFQQNGHTNKSSIPFSWVPGYKTPEGDPIQTGGSIEGIVVDVADKARSGRKSRVFWEECNILDTEVLMSDGSLEKVQNIKVGDFLMGPDSTPRKVLRTTRGKGKILTMRRKSRKDNQREALMYVTPNHKLWVRVKREGVDYEMAIRAKDYKKLGSDIKMGMYGICPEIINFPAKSLGLDPYYLGMWLGNGESCSTGLAIDEKDNELKNYLYQLKDSLDSHIITTYALPNKKYSKGNQCVYYTITPDKESKVKNQLLEGLKAYSLLNNKHVPHDFKTASEEDRLQLLAGMIDTKGSLINRTPANGYKSEHFRIKLADSDLIDGLEFVAKSLGFFTYKYFHKPNKNGHVKYTLNIKGDIHRIPTKVLTKQAQIAEKRNLFRFDIIDEGIQDEYVGLTLDGDSLYLTDNFIVTHNCGANPVMGSSLQVAKALVERSGGIKTGIHVMWGTSNESNKGIDAFKRILLNPKGYKALRFKNVHFNLNEEPEKIPNLPNNPFTYLIPFDSDEKGVGYFIPYFDIIKLDKDGNPNREEGIKHILEERKNMLANAENNQSVENDVMLYIADHPITLEEALMTVKNREFKEPILYKQTVDIESGLLKPDITKGNLEWIKNQEGKIMGVEFIPSKTGLIHIRHHPDFAKKVQGTNGRYTVRRDDPDVIWLLYVAGIDSIDQGQSDTETEGSSAACSIKKRTRKDFPLDSEANTYVAFYKNRSLDAKTDHENIAKMMYYFQSWGLLEYTKFSIKDVFQQLDILYLLAFEPDNPGEYIQTYKKNRTRRGLRSNKDIIWLWIGFIHEYIKEHGHKLEFLTMLKELMGFEYETKTKFDLVASMGHCEVLHREVAHIQAKSYNKTTTEKERRFGRQVWYTNAQGARVFGVPPQDILSEEEKMSYIRNHKDTYGNLQRELKQLK